MVTFFINHQQAIFAFSVGLVAAIGWHLGERHGR
jgi:hypothetical protein